MEERITIRVSSEMKAALEQVHKEDLFPARSRQDTYRHLIQDWLTAHGYLDANRSTRNSDVSARLDQGS